MQATWKRQAALSWQRKLSYFLMAPLTALVILTVTLALIVTGYQQQHNGRIYTGVTVWGTELGGMTPAEAETALRNAFPYPGAPAIILENPATGQTWSKTPAELGLSFDPARTVDAAMDVGRKGSPWRRWQNLYQSWYYGRSLAPVVVLDEGKLDAALETLAAAVNQPPVNASLDLSGEEPRYIPAQMGRRLDTAELRERLLQPMTDFRGAQIELLIHETAPQIRDGTAAAARIQQMVNEPLYFYLQEPLDDVDLGYVELPAATLLDWMRVEVAPQGDGGYRHQIFLDENAVRGWLSQYADQLYRAPVRARFYFDDATEELVVVAPHVNGRELDVDATLAKIQDQIDSGNRRVPFVLREITPTVHAGATAADLGITELITQTTTWFYGSSDARKHNIARAAANFFGIVVAPGEEFSFNKYLGTVSEADGYTEGLIIVGGRTIKGIGGGVCQVSTTLYQTAFLAGFPITERWEHGYMLGYYNDGQGPGMDATVYSPIVDMRFINNTPHHLLIENYYSAENEALTFKFYSTSLGRRVEKTGPVFENVVPAPEAPDEDEWVFDEDLDEGEVRQIDWATEGARVTVHRTVYNAEGDILIDEDVVSNYIPYPNVYHYGPGVEPYDYSLAPDDN